MRKILIAILSVIACVSINAQCIKIYDNGTLKAMYTNTSTNKYTVSLMKEYKVTSLTLNRKNVLVYQGYTAKIKATVAPTNATTQDLTWTSSDNSIATVDNGIVTGVNVGTATITVATTDGTGLSATCQVTVEAVDPNVFPGEFSVSDSKSVHFTKSNLYWNGSAFKFEANQTDFPTSWDENHVGHLFWTSITDYNNNKNMPYSLMFSLSDAGPSDKLWCGEENKITVDGTSGLYVLDNAWRSGYNYLLDKRENYAKLRKYSVIVTNNGTSTRCTVIAPDDFTGTLKSTYTLEEANALGLVCLPEAGWRAIADITGWIYSDLKEIQTTIYDSNSIGQYISATTCDGTEDYEFGCYFSESYVKTQKAIDRFWGYSVRLVK